MIAIRPYRDQDRATAARIWYAGWHSTGLAFAQQTSEAELFERIGRELALGWSVFLAWDDERPVGFLALRIAARCLDQLFLPPDRHGTGIGTALLDFAKEQLPDGFWLRTSVDNRRACRFYEREGMIRGEEQTHPTLGHLTVIYRWMGAE